MAATYTFSGEAKTLLGGLDYDRFRAYITCDQDKLTDPDSGEVRILGEADLVPLVIGGAGSTAFSVDLPGNGWLPSPHFYTLHVEARNLTQGVNRIVTSQPFQLTSDMTLADLPQAAPKAITVQDYESLIEARDEAADSAVIAQTSADQAVAIVAADAVPAIGTSRGASTRWYKRIAIFNGVGETSGARISGVLAGNGDIGLQTFQDIYIRANQRGANQFTVQAQLRGFSDSTTGTDLFYRQTSTYVFEIWARRPTFDAAIRFNMEGYDGSAVAVMDTEQTSAPSGLVAIPISTLPTTIASSGNVETTYTWDPGTGSIATITEHYPTPIGNRVTTYSAYNTAGDPTHEVDPDGGAWTLAYDLAGNLISRTEAA